MKLVQLPFPFVYLAMLEILLAVHWVYTPFQIAIWTVGPASATGLTFIMMFIMWSLYGMASELDNPFGDDDVDLDRHVMQQEFNKRLLHLLQHSSGPTPSL